MALNVALSSVNLAASPARKFVEAVGPSTIERWLR